MKITNLKHARELAKMVKKSTLIDYHFENGSYIGITTFWYDEDIKLFKFKSQGVNWKDKAPTIIDFKNAVSFIYRERKWLNMDDDISLM